MLGFNLVVSFKEQKSERHILSNGPVFRDLAVHVVLQNQEFSFLSIATIATNYAWKIGPIVEIINLFTKLTN